MQTFMEAKGGRISLAVYFLILFAIMKSYWGATSVFHKQNRTVPPLL